MAGADFTPTVIRSGSAVGYAWGQCTAYVYSVVGWAGSQWGSAAEWGNKARAQGLTVNSTPSVGSIAQWTAGQGGSTGAGHVAEVVGFSGNGLPIVSEENYNANGGGLNKVDVRTLTSSDATSASYIHAPGGTPVPSSSANTTGAAATTTSTTTSSSPFSFAQFGTSTMLVLLAIAVLAIGIVAIVHHNSSGGVGVGTIAKVAAA